MERRLKNQLTLLLTLFTLSVVSAQPADTTISEVYFRVKTATPYQVKIGDSVYQNIKKLIVPKGDNRFQIWAPGYEVLDTVIHLRYQHYGFKQELVALPDMLTYEAKLKKYEIAPKISRIPFYVAIPAAAYTISNYRNANVYYDSTNVLLSRYYKAPFKSGLRVITTEEARRDYDAAKDTYARHYQNYYIGASATGALVITGAVLSYIYSKKRRPKPQYQGLDSNPFTMTSMQINVVSNTPVVSLSFEF
jgi:hypothetical protein